MTEHIRSGRYTASAAGSFLFQGIEQMFASPGRCAARICPSACKTQEELLYLTHMPAEKAKRSDEERQDGERSEDR